jgi:hypothetical protein
MQAKTLGVVLDRATGRVKRVMNPTYEWELGLHHLDADERMLRVRKRDFNVSGDVMSLDQLRALIARIEAGL